MLSTIFTTFYIIYLVQWPGGLDYVFDQVRRLDWIMFLTRFIDGIFLRSSYTNWLNHVVFPGFISSIFEMYDFSYNDILDFCCIWCVQSIVSDASLVLSVFNRENHFASFGVSKA